MNLFDVTAGSFSAVITRHPRPPRPHPATVLFLLLGQSPDVRERSRPGPAGPSAGRGPGRAPIASTVSYALPAEPLHSGPYQPVEPVFLPLLDEVRAAVRQRSRRASAGFDVDVALNGLDHIIGELDDHIIGELDSGLAALLGRSAAGGELAVVTGAVPARPVPAQPVLVVWGVLVPDCVCAGVASADG